MASQLTWTKTHSNESEEQFSELGRQHFYKKQRNENIKEQFYLAYLAQNLQESFCSLLQFSTTSKEKKAYQYI